MQRAGAGNASVIERKARPIYEALNRGDFKGSLKQCNQALTKHPKNLLFTVLKALAYERLGNAQSALDLVDKIVSVGTADDEVLHHCSNILKGFGEYEQLLRMYKKASELQPQNLGYLQEVFLAHVRLGQVLEQQKVAMKMSKAVPGELQTFWVVCSMLTQASQGTDCGKGGMPVEMLLKLARSMIAKHLEREGSLSYEGLILYLDILQASENFDECMRLLEGPAGKAVQIKIELLRLQPETEMQAQTALAQKDVSRAKAILMDSLLNVNPDDWANFMMLFAVMLPSTALPFTQAAEGLVAVQGGFGDLRQMFEDDTFWKSLHSADEGNEAQLRESCDELEAFLTSVIEKVHSSQVC